MAGVPAINGLYVSFFNIILYVLLGTSKHLSMGIYAIVSLIVASSIRSYEGVLYPKPSIYSFESIEASSVDLNTSTSTAAMRIVDTKNFISNDSVEGAIMVASTLAFTAGLIQVLFAIFHVGVVTKYLSDSIVGGFTCGSALHVVTSQIGPLLGLKLEGVHITFALAGVR
jgi:MFS superfamily sulfate permease-like transporter